MDSLTAPGDVVPRAVPQSLMEARRDALPHVVRVDIEKPAVS